MVDRRQKAPLQTRSVDYLEGGYAAAVNSGTNAVYVALRALDLEPGSEVIVPAITDAGGTMPVALQNCIPVPADCCPRSQNTSVEHIKEVLTDRTAAIVVAHLTGHPVDLDPILDLAEKRNIPVIEDCAQAHGALYKGRMVGTFGTISASQQCSGNTTPQEHKVVSCSRKIRFSSRERSGLSIVANRLVLLATRRT